MTDIDLVIPMVFPQDPEWQREYARSCGGGDAAQMSRFRSWGTEELLVRCCMKYMPWVRTIHLLLASPSQARFLDGLNGVNGPDGLNKPRVHFVFHRDFIPAEHLPCFSSPCIEMFLHRIPGLSECFIYGNDDMFPLSKLEPEDFFRAGGVDDQGRALAYGEGGGRTGERENGRTALGRERREDQGRALAYGEGGGRTGERENGRTALGRERREDQGRALAYGEVGSGDVRTGRRDDGTTLGEDRDEGGRGDVRTGRRDDGTTLGEDREEGRRNVLFPCQMITEHPFPAAPNLFHQACQEGLNMIAAPFGKRYSSTWLKNGHSLAPYLKSSCEEVWRRHGAQITEHLCPLRRRADSYNQYIYAYYQHLAGIAIEHAPREQYIGKGIATADIAAIIRDPDCGILCLNDHVKMQDWKERAEMVRREIAGKIGEGSVSQTGGETVAALEANKELTIWVSYHKDELVQQHGLKEDAEHRLFATHKEPVGENINRLNPVYSEMVTMWWVWKNNMHSDVVSFEHYRRHLQVERPLPEKGECRVFRVLDFGARTVYQQYALCHNAKDMDVVLRLLDERYGAGNAYVRHIRESRKLISNCVFLMRWEDFTALCEYLFPLLEDYGRAMGMADGLGTVEQWHRKAVRDFGGRRPEYQRRVVSFLAERLISAWIATHMQYRKLVDVGIVHYNTPELTAAAVRSIFKHTPNARITIFDNSDTRPFVAPDGLSVRIIDNTKGQVMDWEKMLDEFPDKEMSDMEGAKFGSAKHCKSVDLLTDLLPNGFVLMDSDVLVKKDITPLVDNRYAWVGQSDIKRTRYGIRLPRVVPFICYLNVKMMKKHGIRYYNPQKMYALSMRKPDMGYDTGCWFHEAVSNAHLPTHDVGINEYIHHFGHGSWRDRGQELWLKMNKHLWE